MKDYYRILGIQKSANNTEIKKAYRKGAMFWHPDKNHSTNAEEKFIEIQESYEILIDPEKRKLYDDLLESQKTNFEKKYDSNEKKHRAQPKETKPNNTSNQDYQKFEDWISEIRRKAKKKANMPFVDDILTESFHFLDKYGIWLIIGFGLFIFILMNIL